MQQLDPKLEIASRLLSGIISQDRNRKLTDRSDDIRHSLDVAAELIRQSEERSPPDLDLTLDPPKPIRTREARVGREEVQLKELREQRNRTSEAPRDARIARGHTLH